MLMFQFAMLVYGLRSSPMNQLVESKLLRHVVTKITSRSTQRHTELGLWLSWPARSFELLVLATGRIPRIVKRILRCQYIFSDTPFLFVGFVATEWGLTSTHWAIKNHDWNVLECLGYMVYPPGVIKKGEETKNAPWKNLSHRTSSKLVDLSTILIWFPEAKHYFPEKKPLVTATGWKFWRGGWNIRWMESHMLHGAGIFTYITGSFFSGKCRKIFQHHGDWWNV